MPVDGLPDPDKHWACFKCERWFESDEGQLIQVDKPTIVGQLVDAMSGDIKYRFRCDECTKRGRRNKLLFWGVLGTIVLVAMMYQLWREGLLR